MLLVADAVFAAERHAKLVGVVALQVMYHHDYGLNTFVALESLQPGIDTINNGRTQHAVGIADVAPGVLQVHHGECLGCPNSGRGYVGEQP